MSYLIIVCFLYSATCLAYSSITAKKGRTNMGWLFTYYWQIAFSIVFQVWFWADKFKVFSHLEGL